MGWSGARRSTESRQAVLEGADLQDFCRRLSNSVWWIEQTIGSGDFPAVEEETLVAGIAYGFSGIAVEIAYKETGDPPAVDPKLAEEAAQIPFGEGEV